MTKRAFLALACSLLLTLEASAEDTPLAGKHDARMRYLAYRPDEVVRLSTAVGATLVVTFAANETVAAVAVSNSKDLAALPRANYLFFKASRILPPQPVVVLADSESGTRRYVFSISTRAMPKLDEQQPDLYYSVQFTYPGDEAAALRQAAEKRSILGQARAKVQQEQRVQDLLNRPGTTASSDESNFHYVAKGDRSLAPLQVFDNGFTTVFGFASNSRIPSLYIINPDGKEAAANFTVKGDYVEVSAVAREWRLRDGNTVLSIFNRAYDPVGRAPGTGTVRPDVWRVLKGSGPMNETGPQSGHDVNASASLVSEPARRHVSGPQKLAVAGLVLISSLSLIWLGSRPSTQDEPSQPNPPISPNAEPFRPVPIELAPEPPAPAKAAQASDPAPSTPQPAAAEPPPEESPIFAYSSGSQKPDVAQRSEDAHKDAPATADEISTGGDLSGRLKPDIQEPSRATLLPHPDLVITQGTIIPCLLQTAVDTNLPGYVKCVLPKDVRGATNNVVLLARGTTVIGEIQHGLEQGDARVFVLWTRIETPDHALVSIASPGADELGRSGVPGTVDNHFRERFGGAMLMSVLQGAFQAAGQYAASSGGGSGIDSFQSNGGQAVETTLRATVNIPPTLKKNQGDAVSIFVARDLDFSDVYGLTATVVAPAPNIANAGETTMRSEADPQLRLLLDPVLKWLEEPRTEEVAINRPGEAFVRQAGVFTKHPLPLGYNDLEDIAILAGALRKQDVGPQSPLCATELPNGERLQICLPPAVPSGTVSLTIRRPSSRVTELKEVSSRYEYSRWNQWRSRKQRQERQDETILQQYDDGDLEKFLQACVSGRLTMLLCGPTGSGKTTMSKTLINAIPPQERLISIEDTLELVIPHENHVRLLYPKDRAGVGAVTAEQLLQASLRMRPDRILLGEMRDDAAWAYLSEVVSGHAGSISTIHGADPVQGFKKLFSLVKSSPQGAAVEDRTLLDMLSAAVDVIVPFHTQGDLYEVGEVWLAADARRRGETVADLLNKH